MLNKILHNELCVNGQNPLAKGFYELLVFVFIKGMIAMSRAIYFYIKLARIGLNGTK
ncbi:hypothetical protein [Campylobacter hyointestinalis]|uniref:hypothetical protein n=1 Tax=Campylobacter hyointestinalis TaxID=198 RepID=UPI00215BDBF2|nr:hypothetical protein [Campylobacter hyointestinalis]